MFRSFATRNYRIWFAGALVSNIGTWMQRIAQDWLVLVELTDDDAVAVGVVMALQFGPQLLLLPVTGWVADRFDRRRVLAVTQTAMLLLGLGLGIITLLGVVELWMVFALRARPRRRGRLRRARPAGLRGRARRRRLAVERRRPQRGILQRRATDRPGHRRSARRRVRLGVGVRDQRGHLPRRAALDLGAASRGVHPLRPQGPRQGPDARRVPVRATPARHPARLRDGVPHRHPRLQLPHLHGHDGARGVRGGSGGVRRAVVGARGRIGGRRPARGTSGTPATAHPHPGEPRIRTVVGSRGPRPRPADLRHRSSPSSASPASR